MDDPTQRQVDSDIEKSMDLFERADVGHAPPLQRRSPQRVLVALDGSAQDEAVVLMAKQLHERLKCEVGFHAASGEQFPIDDKILQTLGGVSAQTVVVDSNMEANYDQILAAVDTFEADLLLVPCPFGRDFKSLGEDSTGTVIDVLTARMKIPFVAIRRPDAIGRDATSHLRLILTGENPAAEIAAGWAAGTVQPAGRLELLLLVEKSFYENFREIMASLKPGLEVDYEDLEDALAKKYTRLNASLQHAAAEFGFTYELLLRYEMGEQPITPEHPETHPALMVLALERSDHDSQGEIHDFVRRSPHPVLVVSVD